MPPGLRVSGHLARASFRDTSRIRICHRNALTEKAWEDAVQEQGKHPTWTEREGVLCVEKLACLKQHKALSLTTLAG